MRKYGTKINTNRSRTTMWSTTVCAMHHSLKSVASSLKLPFSSMPQQLKELWWGLMEGQQCTGRPSMYFIQVRGQS